VHLFLGSRLETQAFKSRDQVMDEIRKCGMVGNISQYLCFVFAALGVISDALKITIGLESMSWFLLAIVFGLNGIVSHMHTVVAKHLLGIEAESKRQG
jgi:hypothetical protein